MSYEKQYETVPFQDNVTVLKTEHIAHMEDGIYDNDAAVSKAAANQAAEYSTTGVYAVGDYCIHDGILYRCTTAVNKKAWNASNWTQAKIGTELGETQKEVSDLKSALNDITEYKYGKNMINPSEIEVGRLGSAGTVNSSLTGYKTSGYIFLEGGKTYLFAREKLAMAEGYAMGYSGYGFYNTSKEWVSNSLVWDNNGTSGLTITPQNDCYIKVCGGKDLFTDDSTARFIVHEGSMLGQWVAYTAPVAILKNVKQTTGTSTEDVMSQKATTDYVVEQFDIVMPYEVGKNKYDKDSCNPQNKYMYNSSGVETAANSYAITGKIPVEAQTQYIFSSTADALRYVQVFYFSGETGETKIGDPDVITGSNIFTTPANCTFVGLNLFGTSTYTTDENFDAAIAASQLEEGTTATAYEPYTLTRMLPTSRLVGGENISAIEDITGTVSLVNLYDKRLAVDGKYIQSGSVVANADWAYSGKIPVKPNTQYCISVDPTLSMEMKTSVYSYGSNGSYLGTITLQSYVYKYLLAFITGADVAFISVNMSKASHTTQDFNDLIDTMMLCYGTQRPLTYSAYNAEATVLSEKLDNSYFNPDVFVGKKWLACGTSITWYDSKAYSAGLHTGEICRGYVGNVARRKALLVTNEGISGSTLAGSSASALINRYQSLDWANTDIATIEYGVNDFGNAIPIGTAEDAAGTDTFAACLKTIIEYALTQNPRLCLVICTEPDVRGSTANSGGHYLYEYTDVTLAIAKQYRLPVCDWYYHSGINAVTKGSSSVDLLTADGTHPNDAGHLRMGAMLNQVFDSLIC